MDNKQLLSLLYKHQANKCTAEELQELEEWYEQLGENKRVILAGDEENEVLASSMLLDFRERLAAKKKILSPIRILPHRKWIAVAAAMLTGILLITAGIFYNNEKPASKMAAEPVNVKSEQKAFYTRHITLPDNSIVVLHANSNLSYPPHFSKNNREVTLTGEAYFDIKHDTEKPFIIHTGKLKITVLGTAFNIKAYPGKDDITVTVTRGKVKVEDDSNVYAVLTPDKQIIYNTRSTAITEQQVNAGATAEWTKQDMVFQSVEFEKIADQLSKRYGIAIHFANPAMKNCLITASFNGKESLENVLSVITTVLNAHYSALKDEVVINGTSCE